MKTPPSLSNSENIIHDLLRVGGNQTHADLVASCTLCPRTIRYALKSLKDRGLLIERLNFRDMRQVLYSLKAEVKATAPPVVLRKS